MKLPARFLIVILLALLPTLPAGAVTVQGTLVFEKILALQGLDLEHPLLVRAPQVVVELRSPDLNTVLARGATDDRGEYRLEASGVGPATLVVWSRSNGFDVVNPATGKLYVVVFAPADLENWPKALRIPDHDRLSGPFNILYTLRRANRLLEQIEPGLPLAELPLTVLWSPTRTEGSYRVGSELYLNGSREVDSDEFDDSIILFLYANYLLERFSHSGSPGGASSLGERLDPRLAFERGWMYFFPQAVLGTPLFIATHGRDGKEALFIYLESDRRDEDTPGYWSIYSVASVLWDLFAPGGAAEGHLGLGLGPIWRVLREQFPQERFPYLITMADALIQQEPGREAGVTEILKQRDIQYRFGAVPPVPVPFPRQLTPGVPATGRVDSLTSKRTNLVDSAHYYLVRKQDAEPLRLQLELTSEPAPLDGVLQLVVFNAEGAPIKGAVSELLRVSSRAELAVSLPAGNYMVGVLSYLPLRFPTLFGSAEYRLTMHD